MLYPLTPKVEKIVALIQEAIGNLGLFKDEEADLKKFAEWVGEQLAVEAKIYSHGLANGFRDRTYEVIYEKNYQTVQELRYKKYWPMKANTNRYEEVVTELTARLKRTELRLV